MIRTACSILEFSLGLYAILFGCAANLKVA
jgi:hypothetical protein